MNQLVRILKCSRLWAAFGFLCGLLLTSDYFSAFGYVLGFPVMILSSCWFVYDIRICRHHSVHFSVTAFLTGLYSNGYVILLTLPFFALPEGTEIRPMGWPICVILISIIAALFGLIFSILGFWQNRKWLLNGLSFSLCCTVWWVGNFLFDYAVEVRKLVLSS